MMAALSPPTLSSLPDSLLLQILVWLPPRDRVGVARVCKRWRCLVQDNFLWQHVDLSSCRISSKILWHLLRNYFQGSLRTLKLRGSILSFRKQEVLTSALLQALGKQCPKLHQLSLMELDLRSFQYGCMPSSLTSLELSCCEIPFVWFQVPETPCTFPRIQQLSIWNVPAFSNQHLLNIATQGTLKTLILSEVYRITDVGVQAVAPYLKDLQHLALYHCSSIGDSAMHFIGRHMKQLHHLDLSSNTLTDSNFNKTTKSLFGEVFPNNAKGAQLSKMDEEKFADDFRTYKGGRNLIPRSFFPIYSLLGISYLLILIGFVVAFSKVSTISSELNKMTVNFSKDPFGHDFHLFPCGADTRQWEYFGGKCYFFSLKSIPWHDAKADCERKQSRLVIIDSLAKQNFIQTRTRNERFWIGLHDQHTEGEWKWLDGSNYRNGFQNWKTGEPNTYHGRDEDCGQVWVNGEWNDYICSSDSFYVCEKPRPSPPKAAPKRP